MSLQVGEIMRRLERGFADPVRTDPHDQLVELREMMRRLETLVVQQGAELRRLRADLTSAKKAAAVRENGKLGDRPRKKAARS